MMIKEHGNTGNKNAQKDKSERMDTFVQIRCKSSDKARWKLAAKKEKKTLSEYFVKCIDN